jgi:Uma2 family endonuclease
MSSSHRHSCSGGSCEAHTIEDVDTRRFFSSLMGVHIFYYMISTKRIRQSMLRNHLFEKTGRVATRMRFGKRSPRCCASIPPREHSSGQSGSPSANISGPPDLVIEILSPGTQTRDLEIKRKLYTRFGVREYWIIDPDAETVEVLCWTEAGYRTEALVSRAGALGSPSFPALNLNLKEIF